MRGLSGGNPNDPMGSVSESVELTALRREADRDQRRREERDAGFQALGDVVIAQGGSVQERMEFAIRELCGQWGPRQRSLAISLGVAAARNRQNAEEFGAAVLQVAMTADSDTFERLIGVLAITGAASEQGNGGVHSAVSRRVFAEEVSAAELERLKFVRGMLGLVSDTSPHDVGFRGAFAAMLVGVLSTGRDLEHFGDGFRRGALRARLGEVIESERFAYRLFRELLVQERNTLDAADLQTVKDVLAIVLDDHPSLVSRVRDLAVRRAGKGKGALAGLVIAEIDSLAIPNGAEPGQGYEALRQTFASAPRREVRGAVVALAWAAAESEELVVRLADDIGVAVGSMADADLHELAGAVTDVCLYTGPNSVEIRESLVRGGVFEALLARRSDASDATCGMIDGALESLFARASEEPALMRQMMGALIGDLRRGAGSASRFSSLCALLRRQARDSGVWFTFAFVDEFRREIGSLRESLPKRSSELTVADVSSLEEFDRICHFAVSLSLYTRAWATRMVRQGGDVALERLADHLGDRAPLGVFTLLDRTRKHRLSVEEFVRDALSSPFKEYLGAQRRVAMERMATILDCAYAHGPKGVATLVEMVGERLGHESGGVRATYRLGHLVHELLARDPAVREVMCGQEVDSKLLFLAAFVRRASLRHAVRELVNDIRKAPDA